MAYSDATRVDQATQRMSDASSVRTNVRAAAKTFGDTIETNMATYDLHPMDQQFFRDGLINMLRHLDAAMNK